MKKFTEIIGAKVFSAYNAEYVGVVLNIQMNRNFTKAKNLIISGNDDETIYLLPFSRIFALGNVVLIRNKTSLSVVPDGIRDSILNAQSITLSGCDTGRITEIEFDDKFNIEKITTETTSFTPNQLIKYENGAALFNDTDKVYAYSRFAPRVAMPTTTSDITVQALNEPQPPLSSVATPRTIIARLPKSFKEPK